MKLNSCACCHEALGPDNFDGICVECDDDTEQEPSCPHQVQSRIAERVAAQAEVERLRAALERIEREAEGCTRLPEAAPYDWPGELEKAIQDLLLDHAEIARAALQSPTASEEAP